MPPFSAGYKSVKKKHQRFGSSNTKPDFKGPPQCKLDARIRKSTHMSVRFKVRCEPKNLMRRCNNHLPVTGVSTKTPPQILKFHTTSQRSNLNPYIRFDSGPDTRPPLAETDPKWKNFLRTTCISPHALQSVIW